MEKVMKGSTKRADFWIIATTVILLFVGLVMVASASSYTAIAQYGDRDKFLLQQLKAAFVGVILAWVATNIPVKLIKKLSYVAFVVSFIVMLLVFVPGLGKDSGGAQRWIKIPGTSSTFQPSEFMKVGLILGLAAFISDNYKKIDNKIVGLLAALAIVGAVGIVLYFQNHMSAALVMLVIALSMILGSGVRIKRRYIILGIIIVFVAGALFLFTGDGFRLNRIVSHFSTDDDSQGTQWQANQSLYAIGSGKAFGRGIGQSRQKYLWLPEAQTDFIFSILAEETGFCGCAVVLLAYLILIVRGYVVAMSTKDLYCTLVSIGIVTMITIQVVINILVVTATIPVMGMPLPLLSHGGTALIINLGTIGILLNMSKQAVE